ncbi:transposase [Candidatus Bathyarchaeota archaeon]|nr:transposase [Candidatus Bathyarchaeota archaeon]
MNSVIKSVWQYYPPTPEVMWLLEQFRQMLNECVHIGLAENVTSLKSLSLRAYKQLSSYEVMSYYKLCAISAATGILRNHRKAKRKNPRTKEPYVKRLRLTTCYGFKLRAAYLFLPFKSRQPIRVPLNTHTLEVLAEPNIEVRSVTLTNEILSITYTHEVEPIAPRGLVGLDRNLDNVTLADSSGRISRHDLSVATKIKATYREVRSHMIRNDHRIRRQVSSKYGRKQREKVKQILHHASKMVVKDAKERQHGIVMEKLTGLRKLYRRGNWQGPWYRGRMNSWSFAELQRQIEYKAAWEGIRVIYVSPYGTSAKCSICGSRLARVPEENRKLRCVVCGVTVDRDVNAARSILARGMRFVPLAPALEAMVQESTASAVILKVDAGESKRRDH